jgi:16S rRNA (cytosine967-C5)-methyltransferase
MDLPRETALRILTDIEDRQVQLELTLDRLEGGPLDERDRRFIRQLVYGCLTWRSRLDWIAQAFSKRPINRIDAVAKQALRMGVYQLLWLDRVPPRAAVHSSVELAKKLGHRGLGAFVNAVLRRVAEDGDGVAYPERSTDPVQYLSVYYSHPSWMVERWLSRWGSERTEALLRANNQQPAIYVRRNTLESAGPIERDSPTASLEAVGPLADCYELDDPSGVFDSAAFRSGQLFVQDVNAGLAATLLHPQPGDIVLDVCSAPGGKMAQMAMLMGGQGRIVACDRSSARLRRVGENTARLGLPGITRLVEDARQPSIAAPPTGWRTGPTSGVNELADGFDRVLVDAPCSSTGVLRRRPDARWRSSGPQAIFDQADAQFEILRSAFVRTRPGGIVVYSTCTLEFEENEGLIERFLEITPGAQVERADQFLTPSDWCDRYVQTLPGRETGDGCFAARIRKE